MTAFFFSLKQKIQLRFRLLNILQNRLLLFIKQQLRVIPIIFLRAILADEFHAIEVRGQLRNKDNHLLPLSLIHILRAPEKNTKETLTALALALLEEL